MRPNGHASQRGYHANIFAALKALASVQHAHDMRASCKYAEVADSVCQHVSLARSAAINHFRDDHDSQSTKSSQSQLVRLQICEDIERFLLELVDLKAPVAISPQSQSRGAFAGSRASCPPPNPTAATLEAMCSVWHSRYRTVDLDFSLCEPLISVHSILLSIAPHSDLLVMHLCLAAKISMKQGNMSFARGSMHKLQMWVASHKGSKGLEEPDPWWIREAKILVCHCHFSLSTLQCLCCAA